MIPVVIRQQHLTVQQAVDFLGNLCEASITRFEMARVQLPSWGVEIDQMVAKYVGGLQDWIVGTLHWSFDTNRYFGDNGAQIKKDRTVYLLPKKPM
jgi:alpha-muurolene/germacrene-A/gamma-muurolene synthase